MSGYINSRHKQHINASIMMRGHMEWLPQIPSTKQYTYVKFGSYCLY